MYSIHIFGTCPAFEVTQSDLDLPSVVEIVRRLTPYSESHIQSEIVSAHFTNFRHHDDLTIEIENMDWSDMVTSA
jgi:hypothetical protein